MSDQDLIAHLLERPGPEVVADIFASLGPRLQTDPALVEAYLEERRIDADLRRLLSPPSQPEAFARGVLAALDRSRPDEARFVASVAARALRRPRAGGRGSRRLLVAGLAAAMLAFAVGATFLIRGKTPVAAAPPAVVAGAVACQGDVRCGPGDAPGAALRPGQPLCIGDRLALAADATATLSWPDGTNLDLAPGSRITLSDARGVQLAAGGLHAEVQPVGQAEPWHFSTSDGEVTVTGTRFSLTCTGRNSTVAMEAGSVAVANGHGRVKVLAGQGVAFTADRAPSAPGDLGGGQIWLGRLGRTWHPLFNGRDLELFTSATRFGWRVEDGAIVPYEPLPEREAAQTVAGCGDAEVRYRFSVVDRGEAFFLARQGSEGSMGVRFPNIGRDPGPGDHELILTLRGYEATATLDGNTYPVVRNGSPRWGCVQVNVWERCLRITAIDIRDLAP